MRRNPFVAALMTAAVAAVGAGACSSDDASDASTPVSVEGVGVVPPTLVDARGEASGGGVQVNGAQPKLDPTPVAGSVAASVDGNHVIVIGDSLMESTMVRYGAAMCNALVPRGWAVEIIAEEGRHIDYGVEVVDEQFDPDWDVAVVMLGNNYRENQAAFEEQLDRVIGRLAPRPTVMFTVTEFEPAQAKVNESIWRVADRHENVLVIDWNAQTTADSSLLSEDGLHLTDDGKNRLAGLVGDRIGLAPEGESGDCLDEDYFDDSIASVPGAVTIPPTVSPTTSAETTVLPLPPTDSTPATTVLPLPGSLPPPTARPSMTTPPAATYQIQEGDTLERIANRYGVTVEELATLNGIADPDAVSAGQIIQLPPGAVITTMPG